MTMWFLSVRRTTAITTDWQNTFEVSSIGLRLEIGSKTRHNTNKSFLSFSCRLFLLLLYNSISFLLLTKTRSITYIYVKLYFLSLPKSTKPLTLNVITDRSLIICFCQVTAQTVSLAWVETWKKGQWFWMHCFSETWVFLKSVFQVLRTFAQT